MSEARRSIDRQIRRVLGAFALGLVVLFIAIAKFDSRLVAGLALAWTLASLLVARHVLRCPLCRASVLNAPVGDAIGWITGRVRRCPRCRTDFDEASAVITRRSDP